MGGQKYTPKVGGFRPKLASHEGIFVFVFLYFVPPHKLLLNQEQQSFPIMFYSRGK